MPLYHYWAKTEIGDTVSGQISAGSPDAAAHLLTLRGLSIQRLEEAGKAADAPAAAATVLTEDDFEALAGTVAAAARRKLPLSACLRTLAEESSGSGLKTSLADVIAAVERGESLEQAFSRLPTAYPQRLAPLFGAGVRPSELPGLLQQAVEHLRRNAEIRWKIAISLIYPFLLTAFTGLLLSFVFLYVVPLMKRIFVDFGTELPIFTQVVIAVSDILTNTLGVVFELAGWLGWGPSLIGLACGAALLFALWSLFSRVVWQVFDLQLWHEVRVWLPLVGRPIQTASTSGLLQFLADLLEAGIPLPESLRIAASVNGDSRLQDGVNRILLSLHEGNSPLDAARHAEAFPRDVIPIFRWAGNRPVFIEALRHSAEFQASQARVQTALMIVLTEPIIVIGISLTVGLTVLALYMPLIKLLNDLA